MTIKEYLQLNKGIKSLGIYKENGDVIDSHPDVVEIVNYIDFEVAEVKLGIFDETKKDIFGKDFDARYIRACIYIKEEK